MKKLMIAAAAAAIIGGANAELVYDFSATLKTTGAKSSSQTSTYTYKFGFASDGLGTYWYDAVCLVDNVDGKHKDWTGGTTLAAGEKLINWNVKTGKGTINTSVFNKLSQADKEQFVADLSAYGDYYDQANPGKCVTDPAYVDPGFSGVQDNYKNKWQWCLTVQWTQKMTLSSCYRVAGNVKIVGRYTVDNGDCCNPGMTWTARTPYAWKPLEIYDNVNHAMLYNMDITPYFVYRFGGLTFAKSTKVEFFGKLGDTADEMALPQFALAGQGTWATLKDCNRPAFTQEGISTISGGIVGVWLDPECEVCCGNDDDALVFNCSAFGEFNNTGASKDITTKGAANVAEDQWAGSAGVGPFPGWTDAMGIDNLWGTAAWGSFTFKYNQKESDFLIH